ncbi:MAG: substrate-binding domain-containing protein [Oscillospiraceae bacterium]|nr:substrate-binding domain-containing protein [Oscillospiraceae bacterium]
MGKVTNKDIALRAGVSQAAVSIAIHGKKGISDATRAHILNIVRELNYKPPTRLRAGSAAAVAVALGPEGERLLPALLSRLLEEGCGVQIWTLPQLLQDPEGRLSGCELLAVLGEAERTVLDQLAQTVPQLLVLDRDHCRKPFLNIRLDYAGAAYLLTRHIARLGHRNFLYLNEELPASKSLICFNGFQRLLLERKLIIHPDQIILDVRTDPNVWSHFPDILKQHNVSAILCTSDLAAVHAVDHLRAAGLCVPEDVSVAALVEGETSAHPGFSFTHLSLNRGQLAAEAAAVACQRQPYRAADLLIPPGSVTDGASAGAPRFDPSKKKLAIALYLKDHPIMRVARAGFLNSVQQMGYQAEVVGTAGDDNASFTESVRPLLDMDVDGVAVWLMVPEAIRLLQDAGIPVVGLHGLPPVPERSGFQCSITEDPISVGRDVAAFFAQSLQDRAGSVVLSQSGDNPLESGITQEITRQLARLCPRLRVFNDLRDLQIAHYTAANVQLAAELMEAHPDLVGVFTTAGGACANWAAAKRRLGRDDLLIIGTDYTEETLDLLDAGEIQAFVAQPIYEETQNSVMALDAILRGNPFPAQVRLEAPLITRESAGRYRRLLQEIMNWYV